MVEAQRRAQEADLVVVNHHLLCADLSLRDEGFGEVLPGADCFIVDEAHQLPEVASSFFGLAVSGRQLLDLTRDLELAYRREAGDMPELPDRTTELRRGVRDLRLYLGEESRRGPWRDLAENPDTLQALEQVRNQLHDLCLVFAPLRGRGKGLDSCIARSAEFEQNLPRLTEDEASEDIRWYETLGQGFRLHRTPLQVADIFQPYWERHPAARAFTSVTLAVGKRFDHLRPPGPVVRTPRHARPQHPGLWHRGGGAGVPILEYSRDRAFLLFTSHRALRATAQALESRVSYPLLVQGSAPQAELLERFRYLGNAVLLGTASFREGVDVRGEALSCVIIDKLPFASPEAPVLAARIEDLRHQGGNPFRDFQLPQAVIALKQGAGRLIRDDRDRGVLVVCNPRLSR